MNDCFCHSLLSSPFCHSLSCHSHSFPFLSFRRNLSHGGELRSRQITVETLTAWQERVSRDAYSATKASATKAGVTRVGVTRMGFLSFPLLSLLFPFLSFRRNLSHGRESQLRQLTVETLSAWQERVSRDAYSATKASVTRAGRDKSGCDKSGFLVIPPSLTTIPILVIP